MLEFLTFFCFLAVFYAYFGYALILVTILTFRGIRPLVIREESAVRAPAVSVIIAIHNEADAIRGKLLNTLSALEPLRSIHDVQVLVASDASTDDSDKIVTEFAEQGVELVRSNERLGKEHAQALALAQSRGDIIIFTDAKVELDKDSMAKLLPYFSDPTVGVVSSYDVLDGNAGGEGAYVRYEMWLRAMESRYHTLVGVSGSCFAARRELTADWREDLPSDFYALIKCQKAGMRGVLAENVICRYVAVATVNAEFRRKVRTVLRGISTLLAAREVMNFKKYGSFAWQVASHKLCRWLVPWFLLLGTVFAFVGADSSALCFLLALGMSVMLALAFFAYFIRPDTKSLLLRAPLFLIVSNLAVAIAWIRYAMGERSVSWQPSDRS